MSVWGTLGWVKPVKPALCDKEDVLKVKSPSELNSRTACFPVALEFTRQVWSVDVWAQAFNIGEMQSCHGVLCLFTGEAAWFLTQLSLFLLKRMVINVTSACGGMCTLFGGRSMGRPGGYIIAFYQGAKASVLFMINWSWQSNAEPAMATGAW